MGGDAECRRCDPSLCILSHPQRLVKRKGPGGQRRSRPNGRFGALCPVRPFGRPARRPPGPAPAAPRSPRPPSPRSLLCAGFGVGTALLPSPSRQNGRSYRTDSAVFRIRSSTMLAISTGCSVIHVSTMFRISVSVMERRMSSTACGYNDRPRTGTAPSGGALPAAAVPRRSGFVTPRSLPSQGRAEGWVCHCPILWAGRCVQKVSASAAPPFHRRRKPPACGGRPEGPGGFKSPPESNLPRPNHQGPRDHPAWHIGGAENKRPQRPHPPKGARPAHRPRRRPPSDDRPALGGRARRRRDREAAAPMAQRARRGPPDVGGPTGQRPGPQAVTRRSDARPQAMAPGPHPST